MEKIFVLGAGTMGAGIVQAFAQKGYEVITIGGLYGTVDEVDTEKKTIVLDVDGVYLTFELAAIKTVLQLKETASLEGAIEK